MSNYLSFCLHSPQVCIQLVSSTWLEGSNLANRSRTPQNASRAEKQKLKCKLYSLRKIDIFCYVHKTDGPQLRHPLPNHSVCEAPCKVPRCRPVIWFKFPCTRIRNRLRHFYHKTHVSKPYSPVHVSPHLSTFDESELFSHFVVFWGTLLASVVLTRLCLDVDSEVRTQNIF